MAVTVSACAWKGLGPPPSSPSSHEKRRASEVTPQDFRVDTSNSSAGFRAAIAAVKANGGGRLRVPRVDGGTYTFHIASEADCLLIDFENFQLTCDPGVVFKWDYYGLPLIAVLGARHVDLGPIKFVWNGERSASPKTANHFGYDGEGILSPSEWCSHICVGGSSFVRLHDISWEGSTPSNNLENGIAIWSGTASGPSGKADVVGNIIEDILSNDVYFGVIGHGLDRFIFRNWQSDRYISAPGHIGPGHLLYLSNSCTNGTIHNLEDRGTAVDPIAESSAWSFQFIGLQNTKVRNLRSKRVSGIVSILSKWADCLDNTFEDFAWEADRVADERTLRDVPAAVIAQGSADRLMSRNIFRNWVLHDKRNVAAGRSAHCAIVGQAGNVYRSQQATENEFEKIGIYHAPGASYSHGVCQLFGQRSVFDIRYVNYGRIAKNHFQLLEDKAGSRSDDNMVTLTISGVTPDPYFDVAGTRNRISIRTRSKLANAGNVAFGNMVTVQPLD
jgi:hypothetical protein